MYHFFFSIFLHDHFPSFQSPFVLKCKPCNLYRQTLGVQWRTLSSFIHLFMSVCDISALQCLINWKCYCCERETSRSSLAMKWCNAVSKCRSAKCVPNCLWRQHQHKNTRSWMRLHGQTAMGCPTSTCKCDSQVSTYFLLCCVYSWW